VYSDFDFARTTPSYGGRGHELSTGLEFFLKPIAILPDSSNDRFFPEVAKLSALEHSSLLYLEGFCELPLTLIYDYHPNGSLHDLLSDQTRVSAARWNNTAKHIVLFGVAEAMWWLHHKRIMHRNLSPTNIILTGTCICSSATRESRASTTSQQRTWCPNCWARRSTNRRLMSGHLEWSLIT
jgi:serine/threonine protein kinase